MPVRNSFLKSSWTAWSHPYSLSRDERHAKLVAFFQCERWQASLLWADVYDNARICSLTARFLCCLACEANFNLPICARYIASMRYSRCQEQRSDAGQE